MAFPHLLRNLPELEQSAAGRGLFSIRPEWDGIVRRVPIVMKAEDKIVPALTLDLLRVVTGSGAILIRTDEAGVRAVAVPGLELPTDPNGRIWVHFGLHDKARYVSAKDVIEGKVASEKLAGKLVLVGTSAIGLLDVKTTPVHAAMPGVEVHAQLLEAALTNSLLASPAISLSVEMLCALVAGTALSLVGPARKRSHAVRDCHIRGAGFHRRILDCLQPLPDNVRCDLPTHRHTFGIYEPGFVGYFREQLDRRRIRSAFAQYLSPTLVERLAQSPKQLVLGGEDRVMTVLFSDVRDFTTIAETLQGQPAAG